jgi:hypothetical protein
MLFSRAAPSGLIPDYRNLPRLMLRRNRPFVEPLQAFGRVFKNPPRQQSRNHCHAPLTGSAPRDILAKFHAE